MPPRSRLISVFLASPYCFLTSSKLSRTILRTLSGFAKISLKSAIAQCKNQVESDNTGETVKELGQINFPSEDNIDAEKICTLLELFDKQLSDIEKSIDEDIQKLRVVDRDGHVLYSANPKDLIIKKTYHITYI